MLDERCCAKGQDQFVWSDNLFDDMIAGNPDMGQGKENCLFYQLGSNLVVVEDELCYARRVGCPITAFHTLINPTSKEH